MSSERLLDENNAAGIKRFFSYNEQADTYTIRTEQEVTDLVDSNKAAANAASGNWKGDMHKVASIPLNVYYDLKRRGILDDPKRLKAWLNDPDNRHFRTKHGRV